MTLSKPESRTDSVSSFLDKLSLIGARLIDSSSFLLAIFEFFVILFLLKNDTNSIHNVYTKYVQEKLTNSNQNHNSLNSLEIKYNLSSAAQNLSNKQIQEKSIRLSRSVIENKCCHI